MIIFLARFNQSIEEAKKFKKGCAVYLKDVPKPENYGVIKIKNSKIDLIVEKPKNLYLTQ